MLKCIIVAILIAGFIIWADKKFNWKLDFGKLAIFFSGLSVLISLFTLVYSC